jgi:hypothetical protein
METDLSIDYPRSNSKTPYQDNDHFKKKIKAEKLEELKTLSEKLAMNAEYMVFFGPSLPYDEEYLERLNAELRKLKIKHALNIPYALTHVNKGNSEDHVHPGFSSECSRYYLELLRHSEINGEIIKASKP